MVYCDLGYVIEWVDEEWWGIKVLLGFFEFFFCFCVIFGVVEEGLRRWDLLIVIFIFEFNVFFFG